MGSPLIFDIHKGSLHDGPGIRSVVFLKGCPLRCSWCHNPESHVAEAELSFRKERCAECGVCLRICPREALTMASGMQLDRKKCDLCFKCVMHCPSLALEKVGRYREPAELAEFLLKDRAFYETSGGGVTFSGGEPLMFMAYVADVARILKQENISVAIQTCGYFEYDKFKESVLPFVDHIYYDLKIMDEPGHKRHTGKSNALILENFHRLSKEQGVVVVPRMSLVPGVTDTAENISALEKFLLDSGEFKLVKLPFNPSGEEKRKRLKS